MAIHYAKLVYVQAYDQNDTITIYIPPFGTFRASWSRDVDPTVSHEHYLVPTITAPIALTTGWLWLSSDWVFDNHVNLVTDPKRPKAFGVLADAVDPSFAARTFYLTHGTVVGVEVLVLLDENREQKPVRINLYDGEQVDPVRERPQAAFGGQGTFWLSGSFLASNADVDFDDLVSDRGALYRVCAALAKALAVDQVDPNSLVFHRTARRAAATILAELGAFDDKPVDEPTRDRWRTLADDAGMLK